jgi:hypothetical protein
MSQQGIHTREYNNPGLAGSPRPQRGGLQIPNRTITPTAPHFRARCGASLKDFDETFAPQEESRRSQDVIDHDYCLVSVHILCT